MSVLRRSSPYRRILGLPVLLSILVALLLPACSGVRLVSDYDEATDKSLTAIQTAADDFLVKIIDKAPSTDNAFDKHKAFYEDIDQQIRRLEFRVASIPKNDNTIRLVNKVRLALLGEGKCNADGASLKDLHCMPESQARGPSKQSLNVARRNVNQTISAALALELAKKQGLEGTK